MIRTGYAAMVAAVIAASAATVTAGAQQGAPAPGTYQAREEHQQDRVANGVESGQLTAGETKSLEGQEAALNAQARRDRAADGGKLTAADRSQLNGEQS